MDLGVSCSRSFGYGACILAAFVVIITTAQMPGVSVDLYSTSLRTAHNESGIPDRFKPPGTVIVQNGGGHVSRPFIIREKPVEIDLSHEVSATPLLIGTIALSVAFAFMTARMEQRSEQDALTEPYSAENPAVVGSSSVILWDALFVSVIAAGHALVIAVSCTPCSWVWAALVWLFYAAPLAAIVQPKRSTVHGGWTLGGGEPDAPPQLPICGVPVGVGGLVLLCVGAWMSISNIQYDPTGLRAQTLVITTALDLFVVALGHLWDSPPSIDTTLNARLFYACCASWGVICIQALAARGGYVTEYLELGLELGLISG